MESNQEKRVVEIWNHLRPHVEWPPKKKKKQQYSWELSSYESIKNKNSSEC